MTSAAPYNTPISRWGYVGRIVVCLAISAVLWPSIAQAQWQRAPLLFFLDAAGGVVTFVLVFWRRRYPFAVACICALIGTVSISSTGPSAWAAASLATRRETGRIVFIGVLGMVTGLASNLFEPNPSTKTTPMWLVLAFMVIANVAILTFGLYVGSRRELIWTLRERARQAESEQELRVQQARSSERERIAREMHDVLAHRISLVTMHAGALAYREDLPTEQVRETAGLIQAKAHEALTDLREVLGVLRGDDAPRRPQPTIGDLDSLITEAVDSGMRVDLDVDMADDAVVPDSVARTVYRVVQEGLTNARKHAHGARVGVRVAGGPDDGLRVAVTNPTPVGTPANRTPGAGLGLIGLRERAELAGGRLDAVGTPESFRLEGWLPWPKP